MSDPFAGILGKRFGAVQPRTSPYVRAIVRVRRVEEGGSIFAFEASVTPRTTDWGLCDWIVDSKDEIVAQLRRAKRLKIGQAATLDVILKPWSESYTGPEDIDYYCGIDVKCVRRTLRVSRERRHSHC